MTIPEYFRTREEIAKPFVSDESPVRKAGLTLVSVQIKDFLLPQTKLFQQTGDAKLAARFMTEQTRAWSNSLFLSSESNGKFISIRKYFGVKIHFSFVKRHGQIMDVSATVMNYYCCYYYLLKTVVSEFQTSFCKPKSAKKTCIVFHFLPTRKYISHRILKNMPPSWLEDSPSPFSNQPKSNCFGYYDSG